MRLSPDQLDDVLQRSSTRILYEQNTGQRELDARLALLFELNEELAKDGGQAGTHAYDMMAAVEEINAGQTAVLIELVAALTLAKGWEKKFKWAATDRSLSLTFQPSDIDDMQRAYNMDVKRDGMHVTVTLTRKEAPTESWQLEAGEDATGAREQAPAQPERPLWCVRTTGTDGNPYIRRCHDRADAERVLKPISREDPNAHVENRFCLHPECPSTGCNQAEVTSAA